MIRRTYIWQCSRFLIPILNICVDLIQDGSTPSTNSRCCHPGQDLHKYSGLVRETCYTEKWERLVSRTNPEYLCWSCPGWQHPRTRSTQTFRIGMRNLLHCDFSNCLSRYDSSAASNSLLKSPIKTIPACGWLRSLCCKT